MRSSIAVIAGGALRLALLCALIGLAGGVFYPADTMNHLLPVWLVPGLGAAAWLAAARRIDRRTLLMTVVLLLLGLRALLPEVLRAPSSAGASGEAGKGRFRIVQFNANKGNADPARALAWLKAQEADVIALEEAKQNSEPLVRQLASIYPWRVSCQGGMRCSTVLLSRRRPLAHGGLARGDPENGGGPSVAWMRLGGPSGPFTVAAVHLVRPWPWGDQRGFAREIGRFVAQQGRARTIIAGDFNMTPWSHVMWRTDGEIGVDRVSRLLPSWPALRVAGIPSPPLLPIDHVYAGKAWRLVRIERGPWLGSDHYPLVADFVRRD